MDLWLVIFMLTLMLAKETWNLPLGCPFNGTTYTEGETIRTEEPCLSCTCQRGSLVCSIRVCAEPPDPPSPGCFIVHKRNTCCPQLLCGESYTQDGVELRTAFKTVKETNKNGCLINGSVYAEGSALASSHLCEYCYCIQGEMKCIKPRCIQPFRPFDGCKAIFQKSSCCPTHYDCRESDMNILTTHMKTFGKSYSNVWNNSISSLGDLESDELKKVNGSDNESVDELEVTTTTTTTQESVTEEATMIPGKEETLSPLEDPLTGFENSTNPSFQMLNGNFSKETTPISTEETLWEKEATSFAYPSTFAPLSQTDEGPTNQDTSDEEEFGGKTESSKIGEGLLSDDTHQGNFSQDTEDYDVYDYSEPKLPPSLPNLVIFPFVAADAIVEDKSVSVSDIYDKSSIDRTDLHQVFYKDYFSPPVKTEGGFVPKKPSIPVTSSYEYSYKLGSKPNTTLPKVNNENCFSNGREVRHGEILSGMGNCVSCKCLNGKLVCPDVKCSILKQRCRKALERDFSCCGNFICGNQRLTFGADPSVTSYPFGEVIKTELPPQLSITEDSSELFMNKETKKPVTVAYKNIIVDYYPDHLITSTRDQLKLDESSVSGNEQKVPHTISQNLPEFSTIKYSRTTNHDKLQNQSEVTPLIQTDESSFDVPDGKGSFVQPSEQITTEERLPTSSTPPQKFFYEILKTLLMENAKSSSTAASVSTKHKYSSKIKGQMITWKPKMDNVTEASINYFSDSQGSIQKVITTDYPGDKGQIRRSTEKSFQTSTTNTTLKKEEENIHNKGEDTFDQDNAKKTKPKDETLLKLAGCNIYGKMYRVGKIILELSGPCLECLCTDLGVQCTALSC